MNVLSILRAIELYKQNTPYNLTDNNPRTKRACEIECALPMFEALNARKVCANRRVCVVSQLAYADTKNLLKVLLSDALSFQNLVAYRVVEAAVGDTETQNIVVLDEDIDGTVKTFLRLTFTTKI